MARWHRLGAEHIERRIRHLSAVERRDQGVAHDARPGRVRIVAGDTRAGIRALVGGDLRQVRFLVTVDEVASNGSVARTGDVEEKA